jgi:hypothetical protein
MAVVLKTMELRILGVLIEKSLSQPAGYPMTLNALTAACNQKTNRHPIMQATEGEIAAALHGLQEWQLATQAAPDHNSRVNRFKHTAEERFGWNAAQRALMAELMLRGSQTLGELRSRASRMTHLQSTAYARELLEELEACDPPMVVEHRRQPGQSTQRFDQLLGGKPAGQPEPAAAGDARIDAPTNTAVAADEDSSLTKRVSALEQEVTTLRSELADLRAGLRERDSDDGIAR